MIDSFIRFSIKNKLIVILFTLTIGAFGLYSISQIPVGAVPDITNNQVQVITTSTNLSTQDIEQFITYPIELEMSNLPGVKEIRSVSKFGLSVVTIVFDENLGTYLPRQLIAEKIKTAAANIPEGFGSPEMGPITTGLGEIYQYVLDIKPGYEDRYSTTDLRTIQDWYVKRQLSGIPGVVEVNTWGGYLKQYEVAVKPQQLKQYGISIVDVFNALQQNNGIAGGAYIERENQCYFIRGEGLLKTIAEIAEIPVTTYNGVPIKVVDVANVEYGHANRFGAITANGQGEKVMGQIMMLKNANSNKVIRAVKERVAEVQQHLPEGVYINPIVERSELISKTTATILENLIFGCLIVFGVVLLILGNMRAALVIASLIPLSLLFTISMMYVFGIDANLMSLGALDFGIIIDGAVIIAEFIVMRLTLNSSQIHTAQGHERKSIIDNISFDGASKMMNSAIFGQIIILIVFIPILSLSGVEGKMFRPMALSFSFALLGAMFFGFTWLPVAASLFLRPQKKEWKITGWIMKVLYGSYVPVINWAYNHKRIILGMALGSLIFSGWLFTRMGGEFVPTLDEGDFVIQPVLKTGTSLSKTIEMTTKMENILITKFPEVDKIVSRIGAAEVPTDPMSMEEIDMIIKLKPKKYWVSADTKEGLANKFKEALQVLPNIEYEFTQPIEMRFNELITGVRADLAIKIFGEDLDVLNKKALEVKQLIANVPGAADIILEKTAGLPQISIQYNRAKMSRYGVSIDELNQFVAMAFGGSVAGNVFEGEKRFDLVVRLGGENRSSIDDVRMLDIRLPNGTMVPLKELANIEYAKGPAKISRDNTHRRVVVSVNVRNRDLESVVTDIQTILDSKLKLPAGYYVSYGGQFENLRNARNRLIIAVPIALFLIFIFLHFAFRSLKDAIMVYTAVPLSIIGGVLLLWIRGMPFSISAGVGFIALFGVAVLNGIVLIEHLKELKAEGVTDIKERVLRATKDRLRPVLLTASSAAMGFLPMAISNSAGAEVQRPLATVVIGGLVTSTLLTMIALPLLYAIFERFDEPKFKLSGSKKIKGTLTVLLVLFFGYSGYSQNRQVGLDEILKMTYANNNQIRSATLKYQQVKALKSASISIPKTDLYYGMDQNNIAENNHPLNVIGVQQSIAFPTLYARQYKTALINIDIAKYDLDKTITEVSKNVSLSYTEVIYLMNRIVLYQRLDSLYGVLQRATELSFQSGSIPKLQLLNTQVKRNQISVELGKLKTDLENANRKLRSIVQTDSTFEVISQKLEPILISVDSMVIVSPLLEQQRKYIDLNRSILREEKQKFLPDINFELFSGTNSYPAAKNYLGYQIGISIPLFFVEQGSKVKAQRIAVDVASTQFENYRRLHDAQIENLRKDLLNKRELLNYQMNVAMPMAENLMSAAQKSYNSGEADLFWYLQSLENILSIEQNYLETIAEYNKTAIEFKYFIFQ